MNAINDVMQRFEEFIILPAVMIVFAAGFFLFVWGFVEFLWNLNSGGDNKEGKSHMLWGIVGMFIMVSVYGILNILDNTFGLDFRNPDVSRSQTVVSPNFGGPR